MWDYLADNMMSIFQESGHPIFFRSNPLSRRTLQRKDIKTSPHYRAEHSNYKVFSAHHCCRQSVQYSLSSSGLLRRIISASSRSSFAENGADDEALEAPPDIVSCLPKGSPCSLRAWEDLVRKHDDKHENLPEDIEFAMLSADAGVMRSMPEGQFFMTVPNVKLEGYGDTSLSRECTHPREDKRTRPKGFIQGDTNFSCARCIGHRTFW